MHRAVLSGLGRRWKKLKLLIIAEVVIAVRLSRAWDGENHDDSVAEIKALNHGMKWRSTAWWRD